MDQLNFYYVHILQCFFAEELTSSKETEYIPEESENESSGSEKYESHSVFENSPTVSVGLEVPVPNIACGSLLKNKEKVDRSDCGPKSYACPFCAKLVKKCHATWKLFTKKKITLVPKNQSERKKMFSFLNKVDVNSIEQHLLMINLK